MHNIKTTTKNILQYKECSTHILEFEFLSFFSFQDLRHINRVGNKLRKIEEKKRNKNFLSIFHDLMI